MVLDEAWRLGIGVALGWAALPLLVRLARRSREGAPSDHYRALVAALLIATALVFAPLARGWAGSAVALPMIDGPELGESSSIRFVSELVVPLLGDAKDAWPAMPLAKLLSSVGGLWLALFATGLVLSLVGHLRLRRDYGNAPAAPPRVLERAAHIAAELGVRSPPIHVADGLASAFTYGAFHPVIVIGSASCEMQDADLDFVLRHELCHVARHDTRAMLWIDLAQRCFAGHPSLPALAAEIRFAREARVDEAAAGAQPLEYARFLLGVAEHVCSARAPSPSLVSMADTALERRVEMLIKPNRNRSRLRRSLPWLGVAGVTLGSLVFLAPSSWGQPTGAGSRPIVKGNLSVEQVEQGLFTNPGPMLECYGRLPPPRANLLTRLSFEIDERGRVSAGHVSAPDHPELEPCLDAALLQRTFAAPSSGTVSVEAQTLLTPPYAERRAVSEARESDGQHKNNSPRIPPDVIRAVVRSYYDQFRACYEPRIPSLPAARVTMRFTIGRDGHVSDGETTDESEAKSEASAALAQCVDGAMRSMQFPAPKDGIVTVDYPLMFEAGDEPSPAQP